MSTWLVYADGVREHLRKPPGAARPSTGTLPAPAAPPARGEPVTHAGLRTDLAVARDEIRRLRADLDKLRGRLRLQLGAEIERPDRAELIARVATLEAANRQFLAERDARAAEADTAQRRVRRTRRRTHRRQRRPAPRDPAGKPVTRAQRPPPPSSASPACLTCLTS